jgi:hypothetical protein
MVRQTGALVIVAAAALAGLSCLAGPGQGGGVNDREATPVPRREEPQAQEPAQKPDADEQAMPSAAALPAAGMDVAAMTAPATIVTFDSVNLISTLRWADGSTRLYKVSSDVTNVNDIRPEAKVNATVADATGPLPAPPNCIDNVRCLLILLLPLRFRCALRRGEGVYCIRWPLV